MDVLACPICLDTFVDPQILGGCGHSFCRSCVQRLDTSYGRSRCPTCRQQFRPADVRPNFALQNMLEESAGQPNPQRTTPSLPERKLVRDTTRRPHAALQKSLKFAGLPDRLAECIAQEDQRIGLRIFLLDNSGSMQANDGKIFVLDPDAEVMRPVSCTRWDEVKRMAMDQAEWNMKLRIPCEFILLNPGPPPMQEGVDFVRLDPAEQQGSLATLRQMLDTNWPRGVTPLADRIAEIYSRIKSEHAALAASGQHVMLVIATDGLPTSAHSSHTTSNDRDVFIQQLRRLLANLPVCLVIRLCTDDSSVVEFYNQVEEDVELPMDVLDDMTGEASEIQRQGNGWFAYTKEMHTVREGGTFLKLLDVLDERRLTATEAALLAQMLLHTAGQEALPRDKEEFCDAIAELAEGAEAVYDARTGYMEYPVDADGLRRAIVGFWNPLRVVPNLLGILLGGCGGGTHRTMMLQNELQIA